MTRTRKDSNKRFGLIGAGLIVAAFLAWAFLMPALNDKPSNQALDNIVDTPSSPSAAQPAPSRGISEPAMPAAPSSPSTANGPAAISSGSFRALNNKSVSGKASLVSAGGGVHLRLEDGFSVSNGPDLYVGFGNNDQVDTSKLIALLKATSGDQNYSLPDGFDYKQYSQVFIYCKAFGYPFAVADLPL